MSTGLQVIQFVLSFIIQCLSHIPDLTKLFLSNEYYSMVGFVSSCNVQINRDNCMGSCGIVAESFASLLKQLWEGEKGDVDPTHFKKAFQGYDSQFVGGYQHDSQEFFVPFVH